MPAEAANMSKATPDPDMSVVIDAGQGAGSGSGIGRGIAAVLKAAYNELAESEVVGSDLDDIFWSSINASAASSTADSLDNTFFGSIAAGDSWTPRQQDLSSLAPPSGEPVSLDRPFGPGGDAIIDQVAEYAVREVDRLIHQSRAVPDDEGDYLLFTDGENGVYVGRPQQYGSLYDTHKDHMKDLLSKFYRGNQQELEQVASQIVDNALKGTPIDINKWLKR